VSINRTHKQVDPQNWYEVGKQFVSVNPLQPFSEPRRYRLRRLIAVVDLGRDQLFDVDLLQVKDGRRVLSADPRSATWTVNFRIRHQIISNASSKGASTRPMSGGYLEDHGWRPAPRVIMNSGRR
jgi:hypothetical protein